ncbi:1987_t:CDS:1, partial [Funneliformis geosporum]
RDGTEDELIFDFNFFEKPNQLDDEIKLNALMLLIQLPYVITLPPAY